MIGGAASGNFMAIAPKALVAWLACMLIYAAFAAWAQDRWDRRHKK